MDEILLLLARKNAHFSPVHLTTLDVGNMLGMSQQNASRRLLLLEKAGLIERTKSGITLTKKGANEVYSLYVELKNAFEKKAIYLSGIIVSGSGEGRYYLSFKEYKNQIKEKFGFLPYEGTLNIRLSSEDMAKKMLFLKSSEPVLISGFKKEGRTFGDLFAYPCTVENIACVFIIPMRTHHPPEIIEIISARNLKKQLGKKDGESIKIELVN